VDNPDRLLEIALLAKNFAKLPSEILGIDDQVTALDFNRACSLRIQIYENARESEKFKMMAIMMGAQINGVPDDVENGVEEW
jgi:hypothetical protein